MHSSPLTRKSSIGIEDVDEDDDNGISPCTHAVTPEQDLVLVEGSENGDDEGHTPTGEDSEEEDEEVEMSELVAVFNHYC
jgi:hypothetical protein